MSPITSNAAASERFASTISVAEKIDLGVKNSDASIYVCRFGSSSSQTSQTSGDFCRICHESDSISPLLTPCTCSGSLRYVHEMCLIQWLTASETSSCELCKFPFIMQSKIKPFNEVSVDKVNAILDARKIENR